jgi:hypothetical protein
MQALHNPLPESIATWIIYHSVPFLSRNGSPSGKHDVHGFESSRDSRKPELASESLQVQMLIQENRRESAKLGYRQKYPLQLLLVAILTNRRLPVAGALQRVVHCPRLAQQW